MLAGIFDTQHKERSQNRGALFLGVLKCELKVLKVEIYVVVGHPEMSFMLLFWPFSLRLQLCISFVIYVRRDVTFI